MDHIVYILTDRRNGLIYVGQTCKKLNKRWPRCKLIKRFGHSDFDKEILYSLLDATGAWWYECAMISEYNSTDPNIGYNLYEGGGIISDEVREKLRFLNSGENGYWFGKKFSESHRNKISQGITGNKNPMYEKKHSGETRRKISEAITGEKHPNFGKFGKDHPSFGKKVPREVVKRANKTKVENQSLCGEKNARSKLTEFDVLEIRRRFDNGEHPKSIAPDFDTHYQNIWKIGKRLRWKHI